MTDHVTAEMRRRISNGTYNEARPIPTGEELAREFSTSWTTISRAFRQLRQLGLIDQAPGRGTRVIPLAQRPVTGAVGIWPQGVQREPEGQNILDGIQSTLAERRQHFVVMPRVTTLEAVTEQVLTGDFAAALFIELNGEPLFRELDKRRFPYAVANMEGNIDCTCTWVDHQKTTNTAVRVLRAMGHQRIALLTRPSEMYFYEKALNGYKEAMLDTGLRFDESLVIVSEPRDSLGAYLKMRNYLKDHPAPTGVVAARDYLAGGAYAAFQERGLLVGRDISLIGFDDLSWPDGKSFLTTFSEPGHELGAAAAQMVMDRLISGWRPIERKEIPARLILRSSVGPCLDGTSGAAAAPLSLITPPSRAAKPAMVS